MVATPLVSRHRHITHARARCISLAVHQSRWTQARDGMSEPASGHGHFRLISATRAPKRAGSNAHLAVHTIGLAGSHQYAARSTCACGTPPSFARGTRRAAHIEDGLVPAQVGADKGPDNYGRVIWGPNIHHEKHDARARPRGAARGDRRLASQAQREQTSHNFLVRG